MKCKIVGCDGQIGTSSSISLKTGCTSSTRSYPCSKCKRLYWTDGNLVYSRSGHAAFSDHHSSRPIALINPFIKGQEGKGYTYYVIYSVADHSYLSRTGRLTCKILDRAQLFESIKDAAEKAKSLGFEVEELSERS